MPTVAILKSHSSMFLKKELSKTNIKGYSKMKKDEVIALMMKPEHKDRFHHIVMAEKKKPAKKDTHTMPDGSVMSGKTHSATSKDVKLKPLTKADIADIRKSVPKKKAKKSAAVADTDDELTLTKQDGTVIKMKKKKPRTVGFAFKK